MDILVAPDKFKGSLTAKEVCVAIEAGIYKAVPDATVHLLPMADGGEGSLEIMAESLDVEKIEVQVHDPLMRPITGYYLKRGEEAYVEMAVASGLQLLTQSERSALTTTSFGTGELMRHAIDSGVKKIYLFVGGSATNDGGIGMASALGYKFQDQTGKKIIPTGQYLFEVDKIIEPNEDLNGLEILLVTDVQNRLLGSDGASYQYAAQKGATDEEIIQLELGLKHFSELVAQYTGVKVDEMKGSGAAGGMAVSVVGLMGGKIQPGIQTMLDAVGFNKKIEQVDLIITGEGKMDQQTLQGKVVYGVAAATSSKGIPVLAISGVSELSKEALGSIGIEGSSTLMREGLSVDECMKHADGLIRERVEGLLTDYLRTKRQD